MEPRGRLEISCNTAETAKGTQNMDSHLGLVRGARHNSALDMTLKALLKIKLLKEDLVNNRQDEKVPYALQDFFSAFVSERIKEDGVYSDLLANILASLEEDHSLSSDAAEVLVSILEFWHDWKSSERESLVTRLFTLEEYERMTCSKCKNKPNYPEQSSYGIVAAADSIRDLMSAFGDIKFVDILKMIRMEDKMVCDIKTGGCGEKKNFIHHIISRCPPIFTIVLEWEKNETEEEISKTTNALEWEIDISRLYQGLKPNTKYQLVSMVGCGEEEEEHICLAYEKDRWVRLRHDTLAEEDVGCWKNVVRFCGERKVRPKILFYEAARLMA